MIIEILEKKGGIRRLDRYNLGFKQFIEINHLIDLETINGTFSWNNRRRKHHQITSILDRFLISENLYTRGEEWSTTILPSNGLDH